MQDLLATLHAADAMLGDVVGEALNAHIFSGHTDIQVLEIVALVARIARRTDALLIEGATEMDDRTDSRPHEERITTRYGCRSVSELMQRVTRSSARTTAEVIKASHATAQPVAMSTGERLPAEFPKMRDALTDGVVGVDGLLAVVVPLRHTAGAAGRAAHLAADEELAASARGEGIDQSPPPCADDLRTQATVWAMYLDQDGAAPREAHAMRKRGITLGRCLDGLVPIRGSLLPDTASQLQRIFDSILNPKGEGAPVPSRPSFVDSGDAREADDDWRDAPHPGQADDRTRAQKQHDALATALTKVAASGTLPTLGGAAPTLVVSVRQEDLDANIGYAHINGCDEPVSLSTARHVACSGNIERATFDNTGRIISLMSFDRIFTHHQRKAIALRDGGCVIPGCHVTADWCEIHHVHEHSRGGPTHTDNGVMLCWHHHRTLDTSGWHVRIANGIPEVRGPFWWDSHVKWRPVTKSPVIMRQREIRRT